MLIDFTVENFRSIRDAKKLSMVASSSEELPQNVIDVPELNLRVLKSSVVYGANASGKSNFLLAMHSLGRLLHPPLHPAAQWTVNFPVFLLDAEKASSPTSFKVRFFVEEVLYVYDLAVTQTLVLHEKLVAYPHGRPQEWFRRDSNHFEFGRFYKGQRHKIQEFTPKDLPYLAVANTFGNQQLSVPGRWLASNLAARLANWDTTTNERLLSDQKFFSWANAILRRADFGIRSFEITSREFLAQENSGAEPKRLKALSPFFLHASEGQPVRLGLENESQGTRNFFMMLAPLYDVLQQGQLAIADEFGASMHPELAQEIVKLFHDVHTNPHGAQLVFATHDTSLLSGQLMRRDQIWFTEKDRSGATDLYSLQDFKGVQADEDFGKGYLRGRYGAIPFFGKFEFPPQGEDESQETPASSGLAPAGSVAPGKEIDSDRT